MIMIAPFLIGTVFKFVIPFVELQITRYYETNQILKEYYLLFDLLLATLAPFLISFSSSMTMLDEYDSNLINHLSVTPLGKNGYLASRLVLPLMLSYLVSIFIVIIFSLTSWSFLMVISICFVTCLLSLISTLIVFSYSKNKIEGLALAKLSGLIMIGIFIPFLVTTDVQYYFAFIPSFWIGKFTIDPGLNYYILSLLSISVWTYFSYIKFFKKLSK